MHTQNTKKRNKFYITSPKFTIFWKSCQKRDKIARFSRAPCKTLQFCKFAPVAQENFAILILKYGHRAIQMAAAGPMGGGWRSPSPPPRSATESSASVTGQAAKAACIRFS